jgi:hypothetical protein
VQATGFENATYIITVGNGTTQTLNIYLVPTGTTNVIFAFVDADNDLTPVENVIFTQEVRVNGSYYTTQVKYSDITGRVQLPYDPSATYRFTTSKTGYEDKVFILSPIIFDSYNVNLYQTQTSNNIEQFNGLAVVISPQLYYENMTNNFSITLSSPNGILEYFNYSIYATSNPANISENESFNAYGDTLTTALWIGNANSTDVVVLNITYYTTTGAFVSLKYTYSISANNAGTFKDTGAEAVPLVDRIILVSLLLAVVMTLGMIYGGSLGASAVGIFSMILIGSSGILPVWLVIISGMILVIIIIFNSGPSFERSG